MERILTCPECGKQFSGRYAGRAYAGHMWLAHFKRVGQRGEIVRLKQQIDSLIKERDSLKGKYEGLRGEYNKMKENRDQLGKMVKDLYNEEGSLSQRQVISADNSFNWNYCPVCGQPKSKHRQIKDLIYGKQWECPSGERVNLT